MPENRRRSTKSQARCVKLLCSSESFDEEYELEEIVYKFTGCEAYIDKAVEPGHEDLGGGSLKGLRMEVS